MWLRVAERSRRHIVLNRNENSNSSEKHKKGKRKRKGKEKGKKGVNSPYRLTIAPVRVEST